MKVQIDLDSLIKETELSYTKFAAKLDVTTETIRKGRELGEISESLAFRIMKIYPKLYNIFKV